MKYISSLVKTLATIVCVTPASAQVPETGHYFGSLTCNGEPRAELLSIVKSGDAHIARIRTLPVEGSPYFQWFDSLHQLVGSEDGSFSGARGTYIRAAKSGDTTPPELGISFSNDGIARSTDGSICDGLLQPITEAVYAPEAIPETLRGAIIHLTSDMRGGERIRANTNPKDFPAEILSTADRFGSFMFMRVDSEQRTCVYRTIGSRDLTVGRELLHGVGRCADGTVRFSPSGSNYRFDWGGGDRSTAAIFTRQNRRIEEFFKDVGAANPISDFSEQNDEQVTRTPQGQIPFPDAISLAGELDDLGIDTKRISLAMSADEIADRLGGKIQGRKWNFFNAQGLEPPRIILEDRQSVLSNSRSNGSSESFVVDLSEWHTRNRPIRITRRVEVAPESRPLADTFVNAIIEKYGSRTRPVERPRFATRYVWTYKNGALNTNCDRLEVPRKLRDSYSVNLREAQGFMEDIDNGSACGAEISIEFETDSASQVEKYTVIILDVKALVGDLINSAKIEQDMREKYREAAQSGNTNTPDL